MKKYFKQLGVQRTLLIVLVTANVVQAAPADLRNWHCPYSTDGCCPPNRNGYGLYQTKWSRWPGVTDADYQSRIPPAEPAKPAAPSMPPREAPEDFMLPSPGPDLDAPPRAPSNNDLGPPPLTPEDEPRPNILSPPGEDVFDQLVPQDVRPPDVKSPAPRPAPQTDLPFEEQADPFKDDPLFNDDPPALPKSNQRSGMPSGPSNGPLLLPAMRTTPTRLPAAQTKSFKRAAPLVKNEEQDVPQFTTPVPAVTNQVTAEFAVQPPAPQAISQNPLRGGLRQESRTVVPTAAWESPARPSLQSAPANPANPLRN